jgi:hypothetical protein
MYVYMYIIYTTSIRVMFSLLVWTSNFPSPLSLSLSLHTSVYRWPIQSCQRINIGPIAHRLLDTFTRITSYAEARVLTTNKQHNMYINWSITPPSSTYYANNTHLPIGGYTASDNNLVVLYYMAHTLQYVAGIQVKLVAVSFWCDTWYDD